MRAVLLEFLDLAVDDQTRTDLKREIDAGAAEIFSVFDRSRRKIAACDLKNAPTRITQRLFGLAAALDESEGTETFVKKAAVHGQ